MRQMYLFVTVFLFVGGLFSVHAQDLITLKDGKVIEVKVIRITPYEQLWYRNYDNEYGSVFAISLDRVHSIQYEDGTLDVKNPLLTAKQLRSQTDTFSAERNENYSLILKPLPSQAHKAYPLLAKSSYTDSNSQGFGIAADPSGFALFGPSATTEFTKGKLNTQINFSLPSLGLLVSDKDFEVGLGFNGLIPTKIGIFYLGGLVGYNTGEVEIEKDKTRTHVGIAAVNIGYRYILSSGMYYHVGGYAGGGFQFGGDNNIDFVFKPNISVGYQF